MYHVARARRTAPRAPPALDTSQGLLVALVAAGLAGVEPPLLAAHALDHGRRDAFLGAGTREILHMVGGVGLGREPVAAVLRVGLGVAVGRGAGVARGPVVDPGPA